MCSAGDIHNTGNVVLLSKLMGFLAVLKDKMKRFIFIDALAIDFILLKC